MTIDVLIIHFYKSVVFFLNYSILHSSYAFVGTKRL
jgi:hypothetical protein